MTMPKFPPTPNDIVEELVNRVVGLTTDIINVVGKGPPGFIYNAARVILPTLEETSLPTPFGTIRTPAIGLPDLSQLALDQRKTDAMKAAIAIDLSGLVGLIPIVGDIAADIAEDTYHTSLRKILTPEELDLYTRFDKLGPSTIAIARTFMRQSMGSHKTYE